MDEQMKQMVIALKPLFDQIGAQFDKMNERFDKMDERFEKMDGRFDKMDERFEKMDGRFEKMDGRFEKMDGRFEKMDERFDKVDTELSDVKGVARRIAVEVSKLRGDVTDMKLEMATKHDTARQDSRLVAFMTEIQTSRKERILAETSYLRYEDRLDKHEKRLSRLETRRA